MTFFKMSTYNHAVYQLAKTFLVYSLIRFVCPIISKLAKPIKEFTFSTFLSLFRPSFSSEIKMLVVRKYLDTSIMHIE